MNRRQFLLAAGATFAACSRPTSAPAPSDETRSETFPSAPLGLQLYTLRELMAEDVAATLALVAETGFREVEFAGYFGHTPAEIRTLLANAGLSAPASHIGAAELLADAGRTIEHAAEIGHSYVVVPYLDEGSRSLDDYRRHSENFNRWGEACVAAGLQFAYHNHDFEFVETDDVLPYDLLLAETDAELVKMELDLAWAEKGGADAVSYFEAWPGRFPMVHLKDLDEEGREVDIGTGRVDFDRILAKASLAGLEHGFVERDNPQDPRASIDHNLRTIQPIWSRSMDVG